MKEAKKKEKKIEAQKGKQELTKKQRIKEKEKKSKVNIGSRWSGE